MTKRSSEAYEIFAVRGELVSASSRNKRKAPFSIHATGRRLVFEAGRRKSRR